MDRTCVLLSSFFVLLASTFAHPTTRSLSQLEGIPEYCNALAETDYAGNDMFTSPIETTDPAACCERCRETARCVSWVLNTRVGHCWLKNREGPASSCGHCIGGTGIHESQSEIPEACNVEFKTNYQGGDMFTSPIETHDPAICCQRCEETEFCVGWTLNTREGHCWLKSALSSATSCDICTSGTIPTARRLPEGDGAGPDPTEVLRSCEREGSQAASVAAIAACAVLKNTCPPAASFEAVEEDITVEDADVIPPDLMDDVLGEACVVVFEEACKRDAADRTSIVDPACAAILAEGPGVSVDNCLDTTEANLIFALAVEPICESDDG